MTRPRLTRTDWILAAFRALASGGPKALRIEPLARTLTATKGSFYWHFDGPDALRDAMLEHWQAAAATTIIDSLSQLPPGAPRLRALADILDRTLDPAHGGAMAEPALREWGRFDDRVAATIALVDHLRLDFLRGCLREAGLPADPHARLIYAAEIGLEVLAADGKGDLSAPMHALLDQLGVPSASA
ncbi:TetR/AcrR family transcriptional regulator [Roseobacter sp. HKCCA0434]|uniref:TetR/AcrR family transcriptional regulator n=1 Tax=Roseobacter sp. HKCCA0434 TaxID=3079297 RepID=UPI002905D1F4|nr:TetR/AcrR family transcriptional regulator [Roseobacter sp. HKCCA0434]